MSAMATKSHSGKRVVIVTGAAQGIGRAIATKLAQDGFDLGLFDLPNSRELLEDFSASLQRDFGCKVVTVYGDVSREDDVKTLVKTVVDHLGDLCGVSRSRELSYHD